MIKHQRNKTALAIVLSLCFFGFVVLSWWLLFRDERALQAIGSFYPHLHIGVFVFRAQLLEYGLNVFPTLIFGMLAATACTAYFLSLRSAFSLRASVILAIIFQCIVFFSYPVLSTDIFSYIFSDRVNTVYNHNVWQVPPATFAQDPFEQLADWKDQTSVYGAVNQLVYVPAAYLGGNNLFSTVLLYKTTAFIFTLASIAVVLKGTKHQTEQERAMAIRLIFWNPLFVLEILGSGHNDIIMIFFLLSSLIFWKQKKWWIAGLLLALSVQVKLLPIVVFGFSSLFLLQKRDVHAFLKYCTSFGSVTLLAFWYMQVSPVIFIQRVLHNNTVYWQSLPSLVERFFSGQHVPFSIIFIMIAAYLCYRQVRQKTDPIVSSAVALLVYLLFFSTAYWNWYVLWLLVLTPWLTNPVLKKTILIFTVTSIFAYPLLWFSQRFGFGHPIWSILTYLLVFSPPIIYGCIAHRKRIANLHQMKIV